MQGDLQDPPIVIRTVRWKAVLHLVAVLVLAALCAPVARTDWWANGYVWCLAVVFGAVALASLWELIWPGRLLIDRNGFERRDLWRTYRWSWSEARHFAPARNRFYRFVGFSQIQAPAGSRHGPADGLNQDWELEPAALADLLNRARTLWFSPARDPG